MTSFEQALETDAVPTTSFRVGKGIGIVGAATLALLEPMNGELAERLWKLVSSGAGVDDLLEELSTTGLRSLGSFAMAQFEGSGVRVVVRGTGRANVVDLSSSRDIAASGVRTWVEEVVDQVSSVSLCLTDVPIEALPFRAGFGVLPADALQRGTSPASLTDLETDWVDEFREADVIRAADAEIVVVERPDPMVEEPDPMRTMAPSEFREGASLIPQIDEVKAEVDYDYDYDAIYGRTVARSVQSAAVHHSPDDLAEPEPAQPAVMGMPMEPPAVPVVDVPPPPSPMIQGVPSGPAMEVPQLGDHDGHTVTKAQLQAMREQTGNPVGATPPPVGGMGGPTVRAVLCGNQHPNPPQLSQCRVCGSLLTSTTVMIARPPLGMLRFSTGSTIVLDRPALIGRNPKLEGSLSSEIPHLVKLDVGQGLSRTHASVKLEGWQVLLEDLNSANGTTVTLPGREPRRLHSGEPVLLEVGAHIDFGGEISCILEAG